MHKTITPFHLAMPVSNKALAKAFYIDVLGCTLGRESDRWVDLNLFGHQLVFHQVDGFEPQPHYNPVDNHAVPVPHFGVLLTMEQFAELAASLRGKVEFIIEPYIRFEGEVGEQATMFFLDPCGNALEFKAFNDIEGELFRKD